MSEKQANLRRRGNGLDDWNRRRFEQEVAEELGLSRERHRSGLGRGGSTATFNGSKSNRQTGNYGQQDERTGRERHQRC